MPRTQNLYALSPHGLHPRMRHRQKRQIALAIIGVFGFSTTTLVARFLATKGVELLPQLGREGLLAPLDLPGLAARAWVLTKAGQQAAELVLNRPVRPVRAHRFNTSLFCHQWSIQTEFLDLLERATPAGMKAPGLETVLQHCRESRDLGQFEARIRPDLLHEIRDGQGRRRGLALEVERTPKGTPELRKKLLLLPAFSDQFDQIAVHWCIAGGDSVVKRYERVWREVVEFTSHGDEARAARLHGLCSFRGLSEMAWSGYR